MRTKRKPRKAPPSSTPHREFGLRLERAIRASGFSNTALAERIGAPWTPSQIGEYISGQRGPGIDALKGLSIVLDVSLDWLVFGEGPQFRGQSRAASTLETDFCAMLRREMATRVTNEEAAYVGEADMTFNFGAIVDKLANDCAETLHSMVQDTTLAFQRALRTNRITELLQTEELESINRQSARRLAREIHDDNAADLLKLARLVRGETADNKPLPIRMTKHAQRRLTVTRHVEQVKAQIEAEGL